MTVTTDNLMEQGKLMFVWEFILAARCKHASCCVLLLVRKQAISLFIALATAFSARILVFLCYLLSCTLHHLKEYLFVGRSVETVPDNSFYSGLHKVHQTQVDMIELIGGFWMLYCSSPKNGGVRAVQNLILIPVKE